MSTDQICAYCEHPRRLHLNGTGSCSCRDTSDLNGCSCPRFVPNTNTETHEVTAQVLAEDAARELRIEDTANAGIAEREYAKAVEGRTPPDFAKWGGSHCPTDILPPPLDIINHPPHYTSHPSGVECIQITEHMNFNIGNAVKYLWRAGLKGAELADLQKARWYVDREIERLSK